MIILALILAATSPVTYGATANDGNDDGAAFRSALSAACSGDLLLDIPAGTFEVSQEATKLGGLNTTGCDGLTIRGVGYASHVRMVPRQMNSGEDYYLFNLDSGTDHVEVKDLRLDGRRASFSCASGNCEQIHLIRTNGASYIRISDVTFVESYGDAVKLYNTAKVRIANNTILGMRRNGVTVSGLVYDTTISGNTMGDAADQYVDIEPSGAAVERVTITGNNFLVHQNAKIAVAISGSATKDVALVANTFNDSQAQAVYADKVAMVGNTFSGPAQPVYLKGDVTETLVVGNSISTSGTSSCVYAESNGSNEPSDLVIGSNVCKHENGGGLGYVSGAGRVVFDGNLIRATGTGSTTGIGVSTLSSTAMGLVVMSDNVIDNETMGLQTTARYGPVDDVIIGGNAVRSSKTYSRGSIQWVWNHTGYTQDFSDRCRVDGNVFNVASSPEVINTPESGSTGPDAGEGCLEHGDAVP